MADVEVLGRTTERDRIAAAIRSIAHGPRALTIEGEAGIGKTALWAAALDDARTDAPSRGLTVLDARAVRAERSLAHVVLTDLLGAVAPGAMASLPGPQAAALAAALLLDDAGPIDAPSDPRAVGTAVLGVLRFATRDGPVLVAIDDADWADPASVAALAFALRRGVAEGLPVGLLVTQRIRVAGGDGDGASLASVFGDHVEHIHLGPVTLGVLHQVIRQRTGAALTRPRLIRLEEASGGNPLLAIEIGRELARLDRWPLPGEPLPVPADIRQLVRQRLERLGPDAIEPLFVAAAMTAPTTAAVARVLETPEGEIGPIVEQAMAAGLLVREPDAGLRFVHPTIEAAALEAPSADRRRALRAMLSAHATSDEDRGRHIALAVEGPDAAAAATLDAAAAAALQRGAPGVAAAWADLAADLTPADDPDGRDRRALRAARWWTESGDVSRGRAALQRLVAAAQGERRAEAGLALAQIVGWEAGAAAMRAVAEAALTEARDPELRARLLLRIATDSDDRPATARAESAAAAVAALRDVEGAPDPDLLACAMLQSAAFRFEAGLADDEAGVQAATALLDDVPRTTGDSDARAESHRAHALVWQWADDHDRLDAALAGALRDLDLARARGLDRPLPIVETEVALLLVRAGRWDAAAAHAQAAIDAADLAGNPEGRRAALGGLAMVDLVRGDLTAAQARLDAADPPGTAADWLTVRHRAIAGALALVRGDARSAVATLGPLLDEQVALGHGETLQHRFAGDLVEAALATGDIGRARATVTVLTGSTTRRPRPWIAVVAARCLALLAAAEGDLDAAESAIQAALSNCDALSMPLERARTELAAGRIARRRKERRRAGEHLGRAAEGFRTLGATAWLAIAEAEIARLGRRSGGSDALTETETQVARLAAAGLTNREVGEAAFLTAKSVEGVLARVYQKLGIRSRAELGAWLAALPADDQPGHRDGIPPFQEGKTGT